MTAYILTCLGLALFTVAGAGDPITLVPYPALVGYYLAVERRDRALGLVALGVVLGVMLSGSVALGLAYGVAAASGLSFARGWRVGQAAAVVAATLTALAIGMVAAHPQETLDNVLNQFNQMAVAFGGPDLDREAVAEDMKAIGALMPYVGFGFLSGLVTLSVCLATALLARRLQAVGRSEKLPGRFRDARTPDWLVWVAIAVTLLWFIEDRWPNGALRLVTWNLAVALVPLYWLNGLGIVLYGLKAFNMRGFWYYAPLVLVFLPQSGGSLVLTSIGFFDTWWEVRRRMDVAAARLKNQQRDNE
jgi:hypothetical protein